MAVDFANDLLLITCASGRQSSHLLKHIATKWSRLRLACNSPASQERLQSQYPNADVIRLDMTDRAACRAAFQGVSACFLVLPAFHPHETQLGYNMIDAAIAASSTPDTIRSDGRAASGSVSVQNSKGPFKHFVYSSVLNSVIRKLLNHDCKRYIEEYLIESGLNYTILQPTHVMQTFPLAALAEESEKPVFTIAWDPEVPFGFLDCEDLGQIGARVLEEWERHFLARYDLCGTTPQTYTQTVEIVSRVMGKEIGIQQPNYNEAFTVFRARLFGDGPQHAGMVDGLERLLLYYNRHGLCGSPVIAEMLLGRTPNGTEAWARRELAQIRAEKN